MRAFTRAFRVLSVSAALAGCANPGELGDEDPKAPGEAIGFFTVAGKLSADSCGAESLNAPAEWSFDVKLTRDGSTLYWLNGREAIVGQIDKAGSFDFETHLDLPLAERHGAAKGCTIVRRDSAQGTLAKSEDALSLKLSYGYSATSDSDCAEFATGTDGLPLLLPCSMTYSLRGQRIAE